MSVTFFTYVWHYLAARAVYEHVVRPLTHGQPAPLLMVAVVAMAAFLVGRWSARRRSL